MGKGQSVIRSLFVLGLFSFASCGFEQLDYGDATDVTFENESGSYTTGESLEGGAVTEVSFDDAKLGTVNFGDVTDTARYVLAVYSYNKGGNSDTYRVGSEADLNLPPSLTGNSSRFAAHDLTEDFHQQLRNEEALLIPPDTTADIINRAVSRQAEIPDTGSTRTFKVISSFGAGGGYKSISAVLIYKTDNFLAWVDERNTGSYSNEQWSGLLSNFDAQIDTERALFGGTEADVDGDGRFNVLFTQAVNELGASSGGIVTGFYYAVDEFSDETYSQSNETEVVNSFVADPTGAFGTPISREFSLSNIHPSVLVHEFQHMINFNMHYFVNGGPPESAFLNEGLAHLAEDIYSMESSGSMLKTSSVNNSIGYMTETGPENPARVAGYLASVEDLCIVCGASLYQRGGSYLLVRYLYEQAEKGNIPGAVAGADLLAKLINTAQTGVGNITTASYGEGPEDALFAGLMGQFGLALFLSDTGLATDNRFQFDGIGLREVQNDNRGTILMGPIVKSVESLPLTNNVGGASISYVEITAEEITNLGGSLSIKLSGDGNAGAYLIQIGI